MKKFSVFMLAAALLSVACTKKDDPSVEEVRLDKTEVSVIKGKSVQLTATVLPETAEDKTVYWESSDKNVAYVSQDGLVDAISLGTADITASCGGVKNICKVTVTYVPVESVTLNKTDTTLSRTSAFELTATVKYSLPEGMTEDEAKALCPMQWKIDETEGTDVVIMESSPTEENLEERNFTAAGIGKAVVTFTAGDKSASCNVTVTPKTIASIILKEESQSVKIKETFQLHATVTPEDNDDELVWESSDEAVATVSESGLVTGVAVGNAKITAKSKLWPKAHYGECDIKVYDDETPSLALEFVTIPAGSFYMGSPTTENGRNRSEETRHLVHLTKSFQIGKYAVTNSQFAEYLNSIGVKADGQNPETKVVYVWKSSGSKDWGLHYSEEKGWYPVEGYENYPAINVTWYGAAAFAKAAGGSLPTEAQWEYACRGGLGDDLPFGIGNGKRLNYELACYASYMRYDADYADPKYPGNKVYQTPDDKQNGKTAANAATVPVDSYSPNGYGIYNMHGNVWEWCADYYVTHTSQEVTDPSFPEPSGDSSSAKIVCKGGSFKDSCRNCRNAARTMQDPLPGSEEYAYGFRIVKPVE